LPESVAYTVMNKRLSLYIAILDINSLHSHEEIIPELLEQLAHSIKADRCVKHPIIVDKESRIILDGVHRVAALKKLRIKRVPVCLVDYNSPKIRVCRWYRTITGASNSEQIIVEVKKTGYIVKKVDELDENSIGVSATVAAVQFRNKTFLVNSPFKNLREAYNIIGHIEWHLRASGLTVKYETEEDAFQNLRAGRVDAVICTPSLSKQEIVKAAVSGQVFASKATRHVISARPMRLNVPLNFLRDKKRSLTEVNEELKHMFKKRRLKRVPPGGLLDGRRYEEELYIFEE